jgi:pantoate--beta-alanine ligase
MRSVLVPTMGSMHVGHTELIRAAIEHAGIHGHRSVVSIFVNPTQFNEQTDYDKYPRDMDADIDFCRDLGVDVVFAPDAETMYPPGMSIPVPSLPDSVTKPGLEDKFRPGHLEGVCQVVARLFDVCRPSSAVFGEKDWQQLIGVTQMSEQLARTVEIIGVPTVRESDGLALSSRNLRLDKQARVTSLGISRALLAASDARTASEAEHVMSEVLADAGIEPEYAVVRDSATLMAPGSGKCRALIAGFVGGIRLLDNAPWPMRG